MSSFLISSQAEIFRQKGVYNRSLNNQTNKIHPLPL